MNASYTNRNLSLLAVNLLTYRIFTQLPMTQIKSAGTAAPLVTLLGGVIWVFVIYLISLCLTGYAKRNILDTVQTVFGNAGKLIVAAIFAVHLFVSAIFTLSDFSKLVSLIAFPISPMWYIAGFLILGCILGALGDTCSQIRLHGFFMPVILAVLILLLATTILPLGSSDRFANPQANLSFDIKSIFSQLTLYGDIFIIFLIAPNDESRKSLAKKLRLSGIAALTLNTLFILAFVLKIPSSIAQNGQFPVYLLMKEVYFGRFFQRLDALILLICALSSMLYLSLNLNLLSTVLHQGFRLPQNRIVPTFLGIAIFAFALSEHLLPKGLLANLIYVFSLGSMAVLVIIAAFTKIRGLINEKN